MQPCKSTRSQGKQQTAIPKRDFAIHRDAMDNNQNAQDDTARTNAKHNKLAKHQAITHGKKPILKQMRAEGTRQQKHFKSNNYKKLGILEPSNCTERNLSSEATQTESPPKLSALRPEHSTP